MIALVETASGTFAVELDSGDVEPADEEAVAGPSPTLDLPRLVAAAASGATVVAVVDAKPPLLVSHDAGTTWRAAGRGLPPGRAVAIADDDPDTILYGARNRLYLSRDGGVFWNALVGELPEISGLSLRG